MTVSCNSIQVILALFAIILVILGRRPLLHLVIFLVMLQAVVLIFVGAMMVRSLFIPLTQTEDSIQNEINEQLNQTLRFHNHFEHPNDPNNFNYFSTYMDNKDVWRKYMDKHLCCGFNGYSDYPENMMVPIQCQCFCTNITEYEPPSRTIEGLSKTASSTWFKVFEKVRQMGPSVVGMGRNRYRVLEVSGIGSVLKYRYRRKIRYRYRVLFDTISILFRYFISTDILTLSCNEKKYKDRFQRPSHRFMNVYY